MKRYLVMALKLTNSALGRFGVKVARTDSPTRSFSDFFSHLKRLHVNFRTVVDIGIANGTEAIYAAFPNARYYLIEPLEECRPTLQRLQQRLDAEYFLVAAGSENTKATFNVHPDLSGSSFFAQKEGSILDGLKREVEVRRLDTLLPPELARPILIKIDTQGAELEVIEGLGDRISTIDMMIIETSLMQFRDDIPEFAEVIETMAKHGFVVYDVLEGHVRQFDRALAQIDLAFVRRDSPLRAISSFFSPAQALEYSAKWSKNSV